MPRLSEAKKDVISCDKHRGLANATRSDDFRMGQPNIQKADLPQELISTGRFGTSMSARPHPGAGEGPGLGSVRPLKWQRELGSERRENSSVAYLLWAVGS
ncbi:hypothetical protein FQR65_LT19174 [Abscondita terminalis]|nr:hypothetical protein FQR65_LT19174 [Abscondita terminalis]